METKSLTRLSPLEPALEAPLRKLGVAVASLLPADEPDVSRDARSLLRRLVPDVTTNPHLLEGVPKFVTSLLDSLARLEPKYRAERTAIAEAWTQVEGSAGAVEPRPPPKVMVGPHQISLTPALTSSGYVVRFHLQSTTQFPDFLRGMLFSRRT